MIDFRQLKYARSCGYYRSACNKPSATKTAAASVHNGGTQVPGMVSNQLLIIFPNITYAALEEQYERSAEIIDR